MAADLLLAQSDKRTGEDVKEDFRQRLYAKLNYSTNSLMLINYLSELTEFDYGDLFSGTRG